MVGVYAFVSEDSAAATTKLTTDHAEEIAGSDYAIVTGTHGRIVWEYGTARDD